MARRHLWGTIVVVAALFGPTPAVAGATVPAIDATGLHLTGGLPDGTVAAGASVDVQIDPGAVSGLPAPTVTIRWRRIDQRAGSDVTLESDQAYGGPIVAPPTVAGEDFRITATVTATNADGTVTAAAPVLAVRSAPLITNSCFCAVDPKPPPVRVRVGQRIRLAALELGTRLGPPAVTAGVPAPRTTMRWVRCRDHRCAPIPRATDSSYTATRRDVGYALRMRLTARNPLGSYTVELFTPGRLAVR